MLVFVLLRCANPVMPLGGEKDFNPPRVVHAVPANASTNFKGQVVTITFDEFIKLEKINQQSLISPAPLTNPEFRIRGKNLQVRFAEPLFDQTTYTLFFGNAIVDLTENNPLEGFSFVFSTGPVLDSMSLAGKVEFAFNLKPSVGVLVMLYPMQPDTVELDSLPFKNKPYYVARTDKQGRFRFANLRNEPYYLFAIEDKNNNLLYDKGNESIAFADSIVFPVYQAKPLADTMADTVTSAAGRVKQKQLSDSLYFASMPMKNLRMFREVDSTQKLLRTDVPTNGLLRFAFRFPAKNVHIKPLDSLSSQVQFIRTSNVVGDTLLWFFRVGAADSIKLAVFQGEKLSDTLRIALKPRQQTARRTSQNQSNNPLRLSTNLSGQRLDPGGRLLLRFHEPVVYYAMRDSSLFVRNKDTVYNALEFVKADLVGLVYALASPEPAIDENIRIIIPDSVFVGLNGSVNEKIELTFKIPPLSEYGNIRFTVKEKPEGTLIVQLVDAKDEPVRSLTIEQAGTYTIELLRQGKYRLKAIEDANRNGRWDTGDVVGRKQPERVCYFEKEMDVRPNWDIEEDWIIRF